MAHSIPYSGAVKGHVDTIVAPGNVHRLIADANGVVYASSIVERGPGDRPRVLLRLEGDALVETGIESNELEWDLTDDPGGPWWITGPRARSLASGEVRDVAARIEGEHSAHLTPRADATYVASTAGTDTGPREPGFGRVRRVALDGAVVWTRDLHRGRIAYDGIRQMRAATGWKSEPMPAWTPRQWEPHEAPIVTGGLVVASFYDFSSGIGVHYGLAAEDGRLLWQTPATPMGDATVFGEGEVAIGAQGYGAFTTELRDRGAEPIARWASHGTGIAIDGAIVVIEMDNAGVDRRHLVRWRRDGSIEHGAQLPGYYSTVPALRPDGTMVFARGKSLWAATPSSLAITELAKIEGVKTWWGRTIVQADGAVLVSDLEPRIWRVR
jgi:hypothetical protein